MRSRHRLLRLAGLMPLLFAGVAAAQEAADVLRVATVLNRTEGDQRSFGVAVDAGLAGAQREATGVLRPSGLRLELEPIETAGALSPGSPAADGVLDFLASGGRVLFGATTTPETNLLLELLVRWATAHPDQTRDDPIVLLVPVATSVLFTRSGGEDEEPVERVWHNARGPAQGRVFVFRTAVSDEEALHRLFNDLRLRYEQLGDNDTVVVPSRREVTGNLVLFVEGRRDPELLAAPKVVPDVRPWQVQLVDGERRPDHGLPLGDYASGFLAHLASALPSDTPLLARTLVICHPAVAHEKYLAALRREVEKVVADRSIRGVGLVGYARFVGRVNGLFEEAIAARRRRRSSDAPDRGRPDELWRFTGGTIKLEDLRLPQLDPGGSFSRLHILRTLPAEELIGDEKRVLEAIVEALPPAARPAGVDLPRQVDDHSLHAYLGLSILAHAVADALRDDDRPASLPAAIAHRLDRYERDDGPRLPFLPRDSPHAWFDYNGDLQAARHVFYVGERGDDGYDFIQTDVDDRGINPLLFPVLGLGFLAAVLVLVNWKRVLGTPTRRLGKLGLDNPYVYGVPVTRPEMYYGRRDAFRKVIEEIKGGCFVLLITGGRRSGKSSFLHFIAQGELPSPADDADGDHRVPDGVLPIYVDLQKLPNHRDEMSFLRHMLGEPILRAAAERGLVLEAPPGDSLANEYRALTLLLEELRRQRPEWMVLLLFDEIELLNDRFADPAWSAGFPRLLRSWVQGRGTRVSAIFTGSPLDAFDAESRQVWAPLGGMMKRLNLGPLSRRETMALASEPIARQVVVEPAVQEEVYHLSGGHPFLCQAICHMAVNALNLEGVARLPARMGEDTVRAAVDDFVENTPGHVDDMWSRFGREERYLLLLMAKRLTRRGESVGLAELLVFARQQQLEVLPDDADSLLPLWERTLEALSREKRFLETRQVARPDGTPGEEYWFAIDVMRRWVQRKPIWPVIDELRCALDADERDDRPQRGGASR